MKHFILAGLLVSIFAGPVFADDSAIDTKVIATDLAECAGMFSSMSEVLKGIGREQAAKTYEDTARGANLGSAYLAHISQDIPKWENAVAWSENLQEATKTYWLGLLDLYESTTEKPFPDTFMEELNHCTALNPIQTELVNMMRQEIYSQED